MVIWLNLSYIFFCVSPKIILVHFMLREIIKRWKKRKGKFLLVCRGKIYATMGVIFLNRIRVIKALINYIENSGKLRAEVDLGLVTVLEHDLWKSFMKIRHLLTTVGSRWNISPNLVAASSIAEVGFFMDLSRVSIHQIWNLWTTDSSWSLI